MVFRSPSLTPRAPIAEDIASLSALDDPVRAAIFFHVAGSGGDVTREQAANALGITRRTAAFHLDKLAEAGLLDVAYKRLTGRTGPGAGRSSKLYRRSRRRLNLAIPARNYELMARLLAAVIRAPEGRATLFAAGPRVRAFGASIGEAARDKSSPYPNRTQLVDVLVDQVTELGFEPFADGDGTLRLRNCPYHEMSREDSGFVCSMNRELMQGIVDGLGLVEVSTAPESMDGMCCVGFHLTGA